ANNVLARLPVISESSLDLSDENIGMLRFLAQDRTSFSDFTDSFVFRFHQSTFMRDPRSSGDIYRLELRSKLGRSTVVGVVTARSLPELLSKFILRKERND